MFFPLYITACLSAMALVSSRPGYPAANAIAEVKKEAVHFSRLMDEKVGSQESRQAMEHLRHHTLEGPYGCLRESDCWRKCDPQENNCEENLFDSLISNKCLVNARCSRAEECTVAQQKLCSEALTWERIRNLV